MPFIRLVLSSAQTITSRGLKKLSHVRDVQFPHLTGIKIGLLEQTGEFEYSISFNNTYRLILSQSSGTLAQLLVAGEFSNGQVFPSNARPFRASEPPWGSGMEWKSDCRILAYYENPRHGLGTEVGGDYLQTILVSDYGCCLVTAGFGSLSAQVGIYTTDDCLFKNYDLTACSPQLSAATARLNQAQGNAAPEVSLPAFYALQSLMKRTPEGQRLVDLYWQHTAEVLRLLWANSLLREQAADILTTFQPGVAALLSGNAQSSPITQSMIDQLNGLWSALIEKASPALKTALEQERARFNNFEDFVNKDFSQWAGLLEIPAPTQPWIFISSATREGGRITVECNDIPGTDLTLWRSGNLSSWEQVLNPEVSRSTHTIRFIDPAPPAGSVFYQIRR
ncbi:MAG: hypothetical protein IPK15_23685 [Verrucomicrobia bacterium]|nr:hypothetical protein [Verrucomicrobiota bacterium]